MMSSIDTVIGWLSVSHTAKRHYIYLRRGNIKRSANEPFSYFLPPLKGPHQPSDGCPFVPGSEAEYDIKG